MVNFRFHRKLYPKCELNSCVYQNIMGRLSCESLSTQTMHSLRVRALPGSCRMPTYPWNSTRWPRMILELRRQVLCQLLIQAVGVSFGVVSSNHPPKIWWCCHCLKRHFASAKPTFHANKTQNKSQKTALSMQNKWRDTMSRFPQKVVQICPDMSYLTSVELTSIFHLQKGTKIQQSWMLLETLSNSASDASGHLQGTQPYNA